MNVWHVCVSIRMHVCMHACMYVSKKARKQESKQASSNFSMPQPPNWQGMMCYQRRCRGASSCCTAKRKERTLMQGSQWDSEPKAIRGAIGNKHKCRYDGTGVECRQDPSSLGFQPQWWWKPNELKKENEQRSHLIRMQELPQWKRGETFSRGPNEPNSSRPSIPTLTSLKKSLSGGGSKRTIVHKDTGDGFVRGSVPIDLSGTAT